MTQVDFRRKKKLAPMFCAALTLTKTYYTGTGINDSEAIARKQNRWHYNPVNGKLLASQEKKLF